MNQTAYCFNLPIFLAIVFCLAAFLAAYVIYLIFLFACRKLIRHEGLAKKLIREIRYPFLLFLFEIAALFSIQILFAPGHLFHGVQRLVIVLLMGTLGWLAIGIVRALYHNYVAKMGENISADISRRSIYTQMLLLYRLLIFAIFVVTLGAILMSFPYIKSVGVGILGSAGIAGIALGIAARPILLNLMAGFQIAATKQVNVGDAIIVEGEFGRVESVHLTHVLVCLWDLRRMVVPISYFIDKPYQNWDLTSPELLGTVLLYCDYSAPVEAIRKKAGELIVSHPAWNKKTWGVQVNNCTESTIEVRILASADNASLSTELRAFLREKLIEFLQQEYPHALPTVRNKQIN